MSGIGGQAPTIERLFEGNAGEHDLRYKRIVESYRIRNLPFGDIDTATFTETYFPAIGTPHPIYTEAVLINRQLVRRINQNECIYQLTYRSNLPFGGAFRRATTASTTMRSFPTPRWQLYVRALQFPEIRYSLSTTYRDRANTTRELTVRVGGDLEETLATCNQFINSVFLIGPAPATSIPYVYAGASVRKSDGAPLLVVHRFRTTGPLPLIPAEDLGGGTTLREIPALGYLDEYDTIEPTTGNPPSTIVVPYTKLYNVQPSLSVLPGID